MMVLGFSEHNAVLNGPGRLARTPNWAIGQWAGLIESCITLPELKNCSVLVQTAFAELESLMNQQVYPDGVETEEAFGYDMWTAKSFFDSIELLEKAGAASVVPPSYTARVEAMFNYGVYACDQHQYSPRDGDADLSDSMGWYAPAVAYFDRDDWMYVHTGGVSGAKPAGVSASTMFPWGGQAIFRNHYGTEGAVWMWMDVGPYGSSGHAHASKNAINLRALASQEPNNPTTQPPVSVASPYKTRGIAFTVRCYYLCLAFLPQVHSTRCCSLTAAASSTMVRGCPRLSTGSMSAPPRRTTL